MAANSIEKVQAKIKDLEEELAKTTTYFGPYSRGYGWTRNGELGELISGLKTEVELLQYLAGGPAEEPSKPLKGFCYRREAFKEVYDIMNSLDPKSVVRIAANPVALGRAYGGKYNTMNFVLASSPYEPKAEIEAIEKDRAALYTKSFAGDSYRLIYHLSVEDPHDNQTYAVPTAEGLTATYVGTREVITEEVIVGYSETEGASEQDEWRADHRWRDALGFGKPLLSARPSVSTTPIYGEVESLSSFGPSKFARRFALVIGVDDSVSPPVQKSTEDAEVEKP